MSFRWLDPKALVLLHDESLAIHGGASGVRDEGLLESALNRPLILLLMVLLMCSTVLLHMPLGWRKIIRLSTATSESPFLPLAYSCASTDGAFR